MNFINNAISYFDNSAVDGTLEPPISNYAMAAVLALNKRQPLLVKHEKTFWTYKHYCPSCSTLLDKEGLNYCSDCGQRLDWSNYFEVLKRGK